jgi:hypothetical protein
MDEILVFRNCDNFVHMINFFLFKKNYVVILSYIVLFEDCDKNWIRENLYIIIV